MARINEAAANYGNYQRVNSKIGALNQKLATGLKINKASDDAAGLAISEGMRSEIKGGGMAEDNISNTLNSLSTANGFLQNVNDMMGRMKELAVQNGNPFMNSEQKAALTSEFDAIKGEIANTFNNAKYNGKDLFQAGAVDVAVDADGSTAALKGFDGSTASTAAAAMSIDDLGSIDAAIAATTSQRTQLGGTESALLHTLSALEDKNENIAQAESRIRDQDMAKAMMNLTTANIQNQSSIAMMGQANSTRQNAIRLLQ